MSERKKNSAKIKAAFGIKSVCVCVCVCLGYRNSKYAMENAQWLFYSKFLIIVIL